MANERRVRYNFVAGGLSVGMSAADTTMQSNGLQDLPALATDEYCAFTLFQIDSLGRVTKKEIVFATAHSAGAGSATVLRGQKGTTAQPWSAGDRWSLTDLDDDNLIICTTATRPTAVYEGQQIYDRTTGRYHWWNGSVWVQEQNLKMWGAGSGYVVAPPVIDTGATPFGLQGGTQVASTSAGGDVTITFPVAFPNGVLTAMVVQGDNTHPGATFISHSASKTGFVYRMYQTSGAVWANSGNHRVNWFAIGY